MRSALVVGIVIATHLIVRIILCVQESEDKTRVYRLYHVPCIEIIPNPIKMGNYNRIRYCSLRGSQAPAVNCRVCVLFFRINRILSIWFQSNIIPTRKNPFASCVLYNILPRCSRQPPTWSSSHIRVRCRGL